MNINRNNYEEYFLLYIDNELSVEEKNIVHAFVAANPDLQEELVMLQQSVIKPMDVDFAGKEALLRPEKTDADTEEKLLLLLDDELQQNEKDAVLLSLENKDTVKKEWEIFQLTKLSPADVIIFKEKDTLFRREQDKVIAITWWRAAAAAMLIGFGLWGAVSYINSYNKAGPSIAANGIEAKNETGNTVNNTTADQKNNSVLPVENSSAKTVSTVGPEINTTITAKSKQTINIQPVYNSKTVINSNKNNYTAIDEKNKQDEEQYFSESVNNNNSNEKVYVNVTPEKQNNTLNNTNSIPSAIDNNSKAINTTFKNDAGDSNTFAFEDDEYKPRKTKLGGLFKRVKRVIERKAKISTGDDDEVRIANMSFVMH